MYLILIDANSIFHRAYHALPPFKTKEGITVNAVYGFTSMLLNILIKEKPDLLITAFDKRGKTFRHEEYADYKATRVKGPDDLYEQFPISKEILEAFSIPIFEKTGFEADDLIGTLATMAEKNEDIQKTSIITGDRDALQLVTNKTSVIAPLKGISQTITYTPSLVLEKYMVNPDQIIDLKGLMGDSSDNIKGVRGIGKKTAEKLISEYKTVENLYENIDKIKGKIKEKLENDRDSAFQSKMRATIIKYCDIDVDFKDATVFNYKYDDILEKFDKYSFVSLISKLGQFNSIYEKKKIAEKFKQKSLF